MAKFSKVKFDSLLLDLEDAHFIAGDWDRNEPNVPYEVVSTAATEAERKLVDYVVSTRGRGVDNWERDHKGMLLEFSGNANETAEVHLMDLVNLNVRVSGICTSTGVAFKVKGALRKVYREDGFLSLAVARKRNGDLVHVRTDQKVERQDVPGCGAAEIYGTDYSDLRVRVY